MNSESEIIAAMVQRLSVRICGLAVLFGGDGGGDVEHVSAEDEGHVDVAVGFEDALSAVGVRADVPDIRDVQSVVALGDELEAEEAVFVVDVGGGDFLLVVEMSSTVAQLAKWPLAPAATRPVSLCSLLMGSVMS
jgi:hypothetical protein